MNIRGSIRGKRESGFILVTVMLMIVVLTLIGITSMIVSSNEILIAGHINKSKEAFYISEASLEIAKYYILNDPMKGISTSVGAASLTDSSQNWTGGEWTGMHLVDNGANVFSIINNNNNTLNLLSGNPLPGGYYIMFRVLDTGESGTGGVGTSNTLTVTGKTWTVDRWATHLLVDSAGSEYPIIGNGIDFLTVSGTPANGDWTIYSNFGATDSMTIRTVGYAIPSYISGDRVGWILVDSNNNKYNIDDATGFGVSSITLTGGVTPVHGDFRVVRPGWMYDSRSILNGITTTGASSEWSTPYTIGSATGTGAVTITRNGNTKGSYSMVSVGTISKSKKAISIEIIDSGNGDVLFRSWQETVAP